MPSLDTPPGPSPGESDDVSSSSETSDTSRLEKVLVKSTLWKKQTLRDIELNRALAENESVDSDTQTARLFFRLSAQLDERNEEIEQLRQAISKLEGEKSRLTREHRRELEQHRAALHELQDAYNQFERESDSLLAELSQQNDRLRDECRQQNSRSLLK